MSKTIALAVLVLFLGIAIGVLFRDTQRNQDQSGGNIKEKITPIGTPISTSKQSLKKFDLSNKGLATVSSNVFLRTDIEELDISGNNLTGALSGEIRNLKNLKVLNVSNNQMTGVPAEIGQLSKLEALDLSNNKLTGLPYELGNLKNLKVLKLSGNDYSKQDLEVIKKGLPASVVIE